MIAPTGTLGGRVGKGEREGIKRKTEETRLSSFLQKERREEKQTKRQYL
jgi:hypothetical protein